MTDYKKERKKMIKTRKLLRNTKVVFLVVMSIMGLVSLTLILLNTDFAKILEFFKNTTTLLILSFLLIQVALMTVLTLRWATILKSHGHKHINLFRLNKYRVAGQAVSFFTPTAKIGGEGIKTKIMSKREHLSYKDAFASVFLDNVVDLTASGLFFFIGAIFVMISINTGVTAKIFIAILSLLLIFSLSMLNYRLFKGKTIVYGLAKKLGLFKIKAISKLKEDLKIFDERLQCFYKKDKKYFFCALGFSFLGWVLMFLEYYVAGKMLGLNFSVWMIFLIVTLVGIAYLIPVPMALGTLEAGQLSAFSILSLSSAAALGLSFIIRAKDMLIAFWGVGILSVYGVSFNKSLKKVGIGDEIELKK